MPSSRTLAEVERKLHKKRQLLEPTLKRLLNRGKPLDVLEIGFGEGRALTELAWKYRDAPIRFQGVDIRGPVGKTLEEHLVDIAREYDIVPQSEIASFKFPDLQIYDATKLRLDDESVDLVYSVVSIRFIERKAEFLEDVCRVLKPNGVGLLHFGESGWDYPYAPHLKSSKLTPDNARLVLKAGEQLIPLRPYLEFCGGDAYRFRITKSRCVILVTKLKPEPLSLTLQFDEQLSRPMSAIPHRHHKSGKPRGGFRSVYEVSESRHAAMREKRLLQSLNGEGGA